MNTSKELETEAVAWKCSVKNVFLEIMQNPEENTNVGVPFFNKVLACNFIKKETPTQVFSYKLCKILKKKK